MKFDGFLKVYEEGRDEKAEEDEEAARKLPLVEKGESLKLNGVTPEQHFTEPPPRYTEATLVKALEEKGIGRPSTYAAIMTTIQDREYVEKRRRRASTRRRWARPSTTSWSSAASTTSSTRRTRRGWRRSLDEIEEGKLAVDGRARRSSTRSSRAT